MNNIVFPDYNNSILNIPSSILKHYGIEPLHTTLADLDKLLAQRPYKNVVLMVFDGMGSEIIDKHLSDNSFLKAHKLRDITSVFPCTTTAATTALASGLAPAESGWIGWAPYFKDKNAHIELYTGLDYYTGQPVCPSYRAEMKFENLLNKIAGKGIKVHQLSPFADMEYGYKPESLTDLFDRVKNICNDGNRNMIAAYWHQPDLAAHINGTDSKDVAEIMQQIDSGLDKLRMGGVENTIIIITADHGLVNVSEDIYLNDYPEIMECLAEAPSLEMRSAALHVKPEHIADFSSKFNALFGEWFMLVPRDEYIEKFLGPGTLHPRVKEFVGDFMAIATAHRMLRYKGEIEPLQHNGHHAGLCAGEMLVPLIVVKD